VSGLAYLDMDAGPPLIIQAAPDEAVRLYASGSACRLPERDSAPQATSDTIEFTLARSAGCFATPPGFYWSGDIGPLPVGTYSVNHYTQVFDESSARPRVLTHPQTLVVGPRPPEFASSAAGSPDLSYGTNGAARLGVGGYPLTLMRQSDGAVLYWAGSSLTRVLPGRR